MIRIDNKWIPSFFTFINLSLGFISLVFLYTGNLRLSLSLLIFALFFDGIDGRLSRKLNVSSIFGKELDSLSDTFSFGLVPAYFFVVVNAQDLGVLHVGLALFFLIGATYQVAKYNTDFLYGSSESVLLGLPVNVAGIVLATLSFLGFLNLVVVTPVIIALSILMMTQIPYPSFKNYRPSKTEHYFIPVVIVFVFIAFPVVTFVLLSLYVVYGFLNQIFQFNFFDS